MKINEGDVVLIDEGLVYNGYERKYKAIILWKGFNNQPLLTEAGKYHPHWGTYASIADVIGHVDLKKAVKWE